MLPNNGRIKWLDSRLLYVQLLTHLSDFSSKSITHTFCNTLFALILHLLSFLSHQFFYLDFVGALCYQDDVLKLLKYPVGLRGWCCCQQPRLRPHS